MRRIFNVSTQAELLSAISKAGGGDTILLAGGNYENLQLSSVNFGAPVTIASADPQNPAIITGLSLATSSNITFDHITFDYRFQPGDPEWLRPFTIGDSHDITIKNSTFDGDVATGVSVTADGYGNAIGLGVTNSNAITIDNNVFFSFTRGTVISQSGDVIVRNNDVHSIRSDGMDFADVDNVLIEGNHFHDFMKSPLSDDHLDMIQFWTSGTDSPSTNITIRGNILDIGEGDWTQSIFMRNEVVDQGSAGPEMFYRNILIEDNVIVNGHLHGITVGETAGLTIRNNTVVHADGNAPDGSDNSVEIPKFYIATTSKGVVIINNITAAIDGYNGQTSWTVNGNVLAQDQGPSAPNYYDDVFIASSRILVGNSGNNVLVGNAAANLLFGHAGADIIVGGRGSDALYGETGADTLYGGRGADTLFGGKGDDRYIVNSNSDLVREKSGEGYDTVKSHGSYTLGAYIEKGVLLVGGLRLTGNSLDNSLIGNNGRNRLLGHAGDDLMKGQSGRDTLSGQQGNDTLIGGAGVDHFVFSTHGGRDVVRDFDAKGLVHDILDLRGLTAVHSFTDLRDAHLHQVGRDVVISAGHGDTIVLQGIRTAELDTHDFLF